MAICNVFSYVHLCICDNMYVVFDKIVENNISNLLYYIKIRS